MSEPRTALLVNLVASLFMTGVIWYVQVVHYPLFARVGQAAFPTYHALHSEWTTAVVGLPMLVELLASIWLLLDRPPGVTLLVAIVLFGLTALIWGVTAFVSVPLHSQLSVRGFEPELIAQLVRTNWIRTLAWSARSV
ncbi:MAG: hypothetical protein NZ693_05470, partial [Thermoflexales bacterium]|nr:hypothetical protein [Thermoflexales bacterium]